MRLLPFVLLLASALDGCGEQPAVAPTSAHQLANGVLLRALPGNLDLAIGQQKAPFALFLDGEEPVAALALEGHAKIADETIAQLEGGVVVAKAVGTTTMHVESEQPFQGTVDVPIVIHAAPPLSLAIEPGGPVRVGESIAIKATATWAEGPSDATYDVEWSTDDRLAISASPTRSVVPLDERAGTLRAKLGSLEASATVTPSGKPPVAIEIRVAWSWMGVRRFGAFARYEDGEEREVSAACAWTTEDKPWRDPTSIGPRMSAEDLAWNKIATCTVAGVKGSGSLFGE
ncbi:MAG: hypothetical protein ACXWUG_17395 [Polyangiales bacterium]